MAIVEPAFANICVQKRLNRSTSRIQSTKMSRLVFASSARWRHAPPEGMLRDIWLCPPVLPLVLPQKGSPRDAPRCFAKSNHWAARDDVLFIISKVISMKTINYEKEGQQ
jgi:hypothetical protein